MLFFAVLTLIVYNFRCATAEASAEQQAALTTRIEGVNNNAAVVLSNVFALVRMCYACVPAATVPEGRLFPQCHHLFPTTICTIILQIERLEETESVVRGLQLVSMAVELVGERVTPMLGLFATALPKIWNSSRGAAQGGDGAVVRLHSALMATLAHLVSRVGRPALVDPGLASVLFPLLQYATSLEGRGEGDVLLDEALKLWGAVMGSASELTPHLLVGTRCFICWAACRVLCKGCCGWCAASCAMMSTRCIATRMRKREHVKMGETSVKHDTAACEHVSTPL